MVQVRASGRRNIRNWIFFDVNLLESWSTETRGNCRWFCFIPGQSRLYSRLKAFWGKQAVQLPFKTSCWSGWRASGWSKTPKIPIKNVVKNNAVGQPHQGIVKTSSVAENIKVGVNIEKNDKMNFILMLCFIEESSLFQAKPDMSIQTIIDSYYRG